MVQESMFLSEECMHPDAGPETCSGTAIRSHTVSRQSALNRIAENGHVMVLRPGSDDDADPAIRAHRVGVSSASTFTGFCATHDHSLFEPIDKADLVPTPEQAFLLAYRSLCRDAFMRRGLLNKTKEIRDTLDPDGKIWGSALRRDGHPVTSGMPRR